MRATEDWAVVWFCDGCGVEVERREYGERRRPGRYRRWCSDACRMRAARDMSAEDMNAATEGIDLVRQNRRMVRGAGTKHGFA